MCKASPSPPLPNPSRSLPPHPAGLVPSGPWSALLCLPYPTSPYAYAYMLDLDGLPFCLPWHPHFNCEAIIRTSAMPIHTHPFPSVPIPTHPYPKHGPCLGITYAARSEGEKRVTEGKRGRSKPPGSPELPWPPPEDLRRRGQTRRAVKQAPKSLRDHIGVQSCQYLTSSPIAQ